MTPGNIDIASFLLGLIYGFIIGIIFFVSVLTTEIVLLSRSKGDGEDDDDDDTSEDATS